jgi:glycosyltransferase involved in cell wall biosynthesis
MLRHNFDLVWVEKEALPWLPVWFEKRMLRGLPFVLDYDDAIFHNYDLNPLFLVRRFFGRRIDCLMASARLVVVGNDYLAKRARDAGAPWVEILPTVIDLDRYEVRPTEVFQSNPLRIVWIGSPATVSYLSLLREPLVKLSLQFSLKLRVIGADIPDMPGVEVESVPWLEETEVASIQEGNIGVMPLIDSAWARGKCGYKLIQYMACGLPVVATPVGVNCQIICANENGFLASSDEEWVTALNLLLDNPVLRQQMGAAGRKKVEDHYCLKQVAPRLAKLLLNAAGRF